MVRKIAMLGALISFLVGCVRKPAEPPPAKAPGTSVRLTYPVLLAGQRRLAVKDDEESLTSTTVSSGLNFPEFKLLDSGGAQYSIRTVTEFGKRPALLDMGTTPFRVFLEMKSDGKVSLDRAKSLVLAAVLGPDESAVTADGVRIAKEAVQRTGSHAELIDVCRNAWEWR